MPESRLQRARATLPNGYQFGDGRGVLVTERVTFTHQGREWFAMMPMWRHPSENAADRLRDRGWNTIEPD